MKITNIECHSVHEADELVFQLGLEPKLIHNPAKGERGPVVAIYCIATLDDGSRTFGRGVQPCQVENDCDPQVAHIAAANDLVRWFEEQAQFHALLQTGDEVTTVPQPKPEPEVVNEWPKWNEQLKAWVDSASIIYDPAIHAGYRGEKPSVKPTNGTFRMKRGVGPREGKKATITPVSEPTQLGGFPETGPAA